MMKKYLMTGVAALTLCAGFTSCSKNDIEPLTPAQIDKAKYDQAFLNYVGGSISPNQDWGFGTGVAGSRITRGENANANEWADVKNSTGFGGWLVPDALTEGQKARVKAYFQANPNLKYSDPQWRNFFVQQVYKGGTSVGSNSTEVVKAANGSTYSSSNMNLMTVGLSAVHINNFNGGDATEVNVLDNGSDILANKKSYHKDKIMLMVDIDDTSCFGYHETGSSNEQNTATGQHNDRAALVSAAVIDEWASKNGNPGEKVVDKWNRSFLGYDLAIKEGDQIFTNQVQKFTSGMNMGYDGLYYGDDNIVYFTYDSNWNRLMPNGMSDEMKDAAGKPLKILDANTNFYSGVVATLSDGDLRKDVNGKVLVNMVKVNELIQGGYYPVSGSAFKTWIKPTPSYDGYYSDWIVTLTEAKKYTPEVQYDLRIIAEDLSASGDTDFDFNDIVLDVKYDATNAYLKLQAAGGTLPLRINGNDDWEVHKLFNVAENYMVNTNARAKGLNGNLRDKEGVELRLGRGINNAAEANGIKLEVKKNGVWQEITAAKGEPAAKLAVGIDYGWLDERSSIKKEYKLFVSWANGTGFTSKWW